MKNTLAIPGARTSASPTVSPSPWSTRTSPAGAPASSKSRSTHAPLSGVSSEGFSSTAFPAATAIAVSVNGMPKGKFHGAITATVPSGSCSRRPRLCFRWGWG